MKMNDSRIALRIPLEQKERIEKLIKNGEFKNFSQISRIALNEFLEKHSR